MPKVMGQGLAKVVYPFVSQKAAEHINPKVDLHPAEKDRPSASRRAKFRQSLVRSQAFPHLMLHDVGEVEEAAGISSRALLPQDPRVQPRHDLRLIEHPVTDLRKERRLDWKD